MEEKDKSGTCKILVVDDEKEINQLLVTFLSRHKFDIISAYSGKEAIKTVKKQKPDLILLDIIMPDMNGLDALKKIKKIDENAKIIMLTAIEDEDTIRKARELGADDYIPKPFTGKHLEDVVLTKIASLRAKDSKK
ncbi:MAG: response regulator [Candidatus Omnitrophica bacterium]|nr:response regulator [Candidatus Omnitrophota bacterium]